MSRKPTAGLRARAVAPVAANQPPPPSRTGKAHDWLPRAAFPAARSRTPSWRKCTEIVKRSQILCLWRYKLIYIPDGLTAAKRQVGGFASKPRL